MKPFLLKPGTLWIALLLNADTHHIDQCAQQISDKIKASNSSDQGDSNAHKQGVEGMMTLIKTVKDVSQLEDKQLTYLVMQNECYLRNIFQGKTKCRRHEDYKNGGKSRRNLTLQVPITLYSDAQCDVIIKGLMDMFCPTDTKYMDYVFRVLLPETLIKIYMEVHQTSHELAEERLADALLGSESD
ncbi:uncharacterized protein LOC141905893 [Tubulanus polymorphus]|uniref:uncharacterized protein LOC141905893 n=1 Tax=Tubulanus polymorphus TaxID=672921 RepID=UPI003DA59599